MQAITSPRVLEGKLTSEQAISVLAKNLDIVCDDEGGHPTVFDARHEVGVSMADYLARWVKLTGAGAEELIMTACMIDRMVEFTGMLITDFNKHRIALAALVIVSKYVNDEPFSNTRYATIGGVTLAEVGRLERQFFKAIDFDAHVTPSTFARYTKLFCRAATKAPLSL
eukprot:TRINITY_DN1395_c0_g3_i1.p2 TRINITY_DN1395_c0_g3~~TRINITY_DN1395_c0_g3_i1.p2  ORF type:complete len:169 (+),score=71.26 TRINITY_DN1395_c0_g3_i1:410-916(+)